MTDDPSFEALLEFLKRTRGVDFTGYKRSSLERRFRRRMEAVGCESFGDYLDYLEVHPEEFEQLFETLLINVTEFFRDPPRVGAPARRRAAGAAGGQGRRRAAARLERRLRERPGGVHVRDGAAELLGVDAFRERVKIYATDIDEDALAQARLAIYTAKEIESVPPELRERYFERADQRAGVPQGPAAHGDLRPQQPRRRTRRSRAWTC